MFFCVIISSSLSSMSFSIFSSFFYYSSDSYFSRLFSNFLILPLALVRALFNYWIKKLLLSIVSLNTVVSLFSYLLSFFILFSCFSISMSSNSSFCWYSFGKYCSILFIFSKSNGWLWNWDILVWSKIERSLLLIGTPSLFVVNASI